MTERVRITFRFAVGQHVRWAEQPEILWCVCWRRYHEGQVARWHDYGLLPVDAERGVPECASEADLSAADAEASAKADTRRTHTFPCPTCHQRLRVACPPRPFGQRVVCRCGAPYWLQTDTDWIMAAPAREETP